jgi:flavin-dependent trigonelline monooxygenase, oxygenase component
MQFSLAINMERGDAVTDMREVAAHTLAMVQMAEAGGFDIVWITEHHAIEQCDGPGCLDRLGGRGHRRVCAAA